MSDMVDVIPQWEHVQEWTASYAEERYCVVRQEAREQAEEAEHAL
jgi:cell wall assembly regulator SMI1